MAFSWPRMKTGRAALQSHPECCEPGEPSQRHPFTPDRANTFSKELEVVQKQTDLKGIIFTRSRAPVPIREAVPGRKPQMLNSAGVHRPKGEESCISHAEACNPIRMKAEFLYWRVTPGAPGLCLPASLTTDRPVPVHTPCPLTIPARTGQVAPPRGSALAASVWNAFQRPAPHWAVVPRGALTARPSPPPSACFRS